VNYFELYNLPVSLKVDAALLKKKFFELSRKYHPDFFASATGDEQADVLEKSSMVNKAFKTFSNADETIKYVLMQKGLLEEEEKYQLPNSFLMEMMDINEAMMDAKMEEDEQAITNQQSTISNLQMEIYEPVKQIVEHYQEGITSQEELLQVKEYYYKKKYLNRILAGMD
jgi:molecular chaperone HscB